MKTIKPWWDEFDIETNPHNEEVIVSLPNSKSEKKRWVFNLKYGGNLATSGDLTNILLSFLYDIQNLTKENETLKVKEDKKA